MRDNHERRMRYNQTAVDRTYLEKGVEVCTQSKNLNEGRI